MTVKWKAFAHSTAIRCSSSWTNRVRVFCICLLWATYMARLRVKWSKPMATRFLRIRSALVRFVSPNGGGHRESCSSATLTYREVLYDAEPNADDVEGQALLQRFRGRRLPMIDRVEISIIEEQQPRWLSFLNRQQDLMERIANEFINLAAPNGKLAPNLQRQNMQLYGVLASDLTMSVYNMDHPVIGGYAPDKVALRRAINLATNTPQEIRLARKNQAIPAQSPTMPNTIGFNADFRSENGEYDLPRAKALLDLYGYVDRDGDGWREQPNGQS